jgi:hypothetical protein
LIDASKKIFIDAGKRIHRKCLMHTGSSTTVPAPLVVYGDWKIIACYYAHRVKPRK